MLTNILWIAAALCIWKGILSYLYVRVRPEEYLEVLTHHWKEGKTIREELEKRKGLKKGKILDEDNIKQLSKLVDKELAEIDIQIDYIEGCRMVRTFYKLSGNGPRKRIRLDDLPSST